jgi:peroxiredoxin
MVLHARGVRLLLEVIMKKITMIVMNLLLPALLLTGVLLSGCSSPDSSAGPVTEYGSEIGKLAPDFELINLDKEQVSLSSLRGKPVLLNFWATWCGPCRIEMPFIEEVHEQRAGQGLVVLAVNVQESPDAVKRFIEGNGFTFPVLLSPGSDVPLAYNVRGIPATFFIDADGVIRDIKIGAFRGVGEIESKLAKIMP